jgi:hypothetical protein
LRASRDLVLGKEVSLLSFPFLGVVGGLAYWRLDLWQKIFGPAQNKCLRLVNNKQLSGGGYGAKEKK